MAVITGIGAVSALGMGVTRIRSALTEGWDGIAPIRRFDPAEIGVALAAMVPERNAPAYARELDQALCVEYAIAAAREAWGRPADRGIARHRIALVLGSSLGDAPRELHRITEDVGDALAVGGPRLTVSTACASSTNAIGLALDLLALDLADAVIAGGTDALTPLVLAGFNALGVLATGKCAPFSEPPGTTLGEGAGFVVLERDGAGERLGLRLLGYGLAADGYHETGPDPTGAGVSRAIRAALAHAGVEPGEIEYVNAHGTGTRANDPAEWRAIQRIFGARADVLPVSSSKSFLGHAQGAAGVLETIATLVAMERGEIPPTQRYTTPRPHGPPDAVGQQTSRATPCETAVCTNSAFGGANCAIVIGRTDRARRFARRPVSLDGLAAIGPHGTRIDTLASARNSGRVRDFRLEDVAPAADPRGLDPSTRYLVGAAAVAVADAGIRLRRDTSDRIGLVLGVTRISPESDARLSRTIAEHGYRGLSAKLFARQVLNAPAGTCARLLGLRGAHSTLSAGAATGLLAFVYAAELLATRDDCDRIVAAGVDEMTEADGAADASEGAACAVLSAGEGAISVAGWSFAGPGRIDEAAAAALGGTRKGEVDLVVGSVPHGVRAARAITAAEFVGDSPAFTSAVAVVLAAQMIRTGEARSALVAQSGGKSADCAMLLVGGDIDAT